MILVLKVVVVYEPTIMAIRHRPDLAEAPRHLFGELGRQQRHLIGASLQTVRKSVAGNARDGAPREHRPGNAGR